MTVYKKLQQARVELQKVKMKKTGLNKFVGYQYLELGDFLPHITAIFDKVGLASVIRFGTEVAELEIIDTEKPEGPTIVFTSPMSEANLKGCHPVQNLGAVQTYLRRYLYVNALEIVEHDPLDAMTDAEDKKPPGQATKKQKPTDSTPKAKEPVKVAKLTEEQRDDMITGIHMEYTLQKKNVKEITDHFKVEVMEDLTDEQLTKTHKKVVGS